MAIYSTFFLYDPVILQDLFPRWKPPRLEPLVREIKNPFTGELTRIATREPDWPDDAGEELFDFNYRVAEIQGDYQKYLEDRLPPGVRALPHWCAKGLTGVELAPLGEATGTEPAFEVALFAPPSLAAALDKVRYELAMELATADEKRLQTVAARWAVTMSTPDYTHSVTGEKLNDGWTTDDALDLLRPIAELAGQASSDQRLYLLVEA